MLAAARSAPDHPAVVESDPAGGVHTLTYRQLERRVHRYAEALDRVGIGIGDRVVLESDNSACAVAALLACSTLGAAFVPVSPTMPTRTLLAITASVEPALYLHAAAGHRDGLPDPVGLARFGPDGVTVERAPGSQHRHGGRHRHEPTSADAAYIVFTSGPDGRPQGVVMSHRGVLACYRAMVDLGMVLPTDRLCSTSPLQCDFSLLDIGLALGSGAVLVPAPREVLRWPRRLLRLFADTGVTQVNGVPSIWRPVLRHEPDRLAALAGQLRGVLFAGEAFPLPELRQLQGLLPQTRIVNCFGWTESMACSFTDVPNPLPPDADPLSVGFAHAGAEMMLVDAAGAPVGTPGVVGEIYLRGPTLFTGYWDDAAATAARLVPDPLEPRSGQRVYRTGDLAYRGAGGELYLVGRPDLRIASSSGPRASAGTGGPHSARG